jgi:signal transduction histidine kinase
VSTIAPTPDPVVAGVSKMEIGGLRRVALVGGSLIAATGLSIALKGYIVSAIFVFFYAVVIVTSMMTGVVGGIIATVVGAILGNYIARGQITADAPSLVGTLVFAAMGTALSFIVDASRRARHSVESHAKRLEDQAVELDSQREEAQIMAEELEQTNAELEMAMEDAEHARDAAIASEDRLRLIDEASRVLASSLDYETTVAAVARLAVPKFADWAAVDLLVDGEIRQLALAHVDEEKAKWARELNTKYRPAADSQSGVNAVMRTGEPMLISHVTDDLLRASARDADHLQLLRSLTIHSAMVVPMKARGSTIGALTLISARPDLEYDAESLALAGQLARRSAMAVDNARLYRAALAANEAKANFLATMSHELRTPLTAIIGYEELLAEGISGAVTDAQKQQLNRIKISATHLLSLIDEILLYARVEAGRESVRIEPVVVKGVVDDAIAFVTPMAADRHLVVRSEPIDPSVMFRTDVGKLRQMLLNLLSNAVKFTHRGEIVVRVSERGDSMAFAVQDTGIGIDREDLAHVFDPFWQVEQTTTRKIGGSGLGLSVTQRLARLLGGDVEAISEPFVGSTFTIVLPKEPVSSRA